MPPPFGTGCPGWTTRGLAETPYFLSARLDVLVLVVELQLVSARHPMASTHTVTPRLLREGAHCRIIASPSLAETLASPLPAPSRKPARCEWCRCKGCRGWPSSRPLSL